MKLSLTAACSAFAAIQSDVIESQARLRDARSAVLASSGVVRAFNESDILARYSEALMVAECAVTEYRDAGPQFAFVVGQFEAANDDIGNDVLIAQSPGQSAVFPLKSEQ
jgi:hypothetical protein